MMRQSGWDNGGPAPEAAPHDWGPTVRNFIAGGGCVVGGSVLIVQNAAVLARAAGVSELVIGLTLVALGTSLPELVTAISSSLRGHGDIAVGNVIGANVLNLTLVLGGAATILPMGIERQLFALEFPVMGMLMALVFFLAVFRGGIGRLGGAVFFSVYLVYLVSLTVYFL
jgi:cation:H+ antiporter